MALLILTNRPMPPSFHPLAPPRPGGSMLLTGFMRSMLSDNRVVDLLSAEAPCANLPNWTDLLFLFFFFCLLFFAARISFLKRRVEMTMEEEIYINSNRDRIFVAKGSNEAKKRGGERLDGVSKVWKHRREGIN